MNNIIIFLSHIINEETIARCNKIYREMSDAYTIYWVTTETNSGALSRIPTYIKVFPVSSKDIQGMGYTPITSNIWGSVNFIIQFFFKNNPQYDNYWVIEYDVIFTGNWKTFLDTSDHIQADLLSSHIEFYSHSNREWEWWKWSRWNEKNNYSVESYVKSFNPIYRMSAAALSFMDCFMREGNSGHFEALIATALYNNGYKLVDFGGYGEFVPHGFENKYYVKGSGTNNGTIRYRPLYLQQEIKALGIADKLFHPVKFETY
ncbi:MAG: DUF3405 domain-containing protein [Bacteroides sp.]|nr:DUF3405 domain-containing protein [Roseburia sp.]MCM1346822.1 DUF3405 domain-containing protein [Bacteroides sp.]MCM1421364.1 DUF3405 domain-containing protein [Bacteroides sp.]